MAKLRGDLLTIQFDNHGSGTERNVIAGTTSFTFDSSSEFLETTDQDDGLSAAGIGGKVTRTVSGDYFATTTLDDWLGLYNHQAAGTAVGWELFNDGVSVISGSAVITSLNLSAGTSADLVTGSYSMTVTGTPA